MSIILTQPQLRPAPVLELDLLQEKIQELELENDSLKDQIQMLRNKEAVKNPEEEIIRFEIQRLHQVVVKDGHSMESDELRKFDTLVKCLVALRGKNPSSETPAKSIKEKDAKALLKSLIK